MMMTETETFFSFRCLRPYDLLYQGMQKVPW